MYFSPIKHFFWAACLIVSCSSRDDSSPMVASVGDSVYTEKQAVADGMLLPVGAPQVDRWVEREVLYQSAISNDYDKDNTTKRKSINHLKQIVGRSYLETLIHNRVKITESEVIDYYNKTREQYKRKEREAVILRFTLTDRATAATLVADLKKSLSRKSDQKLGELLVVHKPNRELVFENRLKENIRKKIFSNRKQSRVLGPIQSSDKFYVFNVVKVFEKGTIKDLIHVQDEIQRRLLEIKKHAIKKTVIDSLKAQYSIDIINQGSL